MNFTINFQKAKRNYMTLTFDDEREVDGRKETYERTICVGMPKKRIMEALINLKGIIHERKEAGENADSAAEKDKIDAQTIDELYKLVALILSNNLQREQISTEWVEEQLDFIQLREFLQTYTQFCNGEAANPN